MTTVSSKRLYDIDWFRGYVCLCLMFLHFYTSPLYGSFQRLFGATGEYVAWNLRLGVESFFVLAGFMMAHMLRPVAGENVSLAGYLKRRFFRLIVPYWIAILLYASASWLIKFVLHKGDAVPSIGDVLSQLFLVQEFFFDKEHLEKYTPVGYWSMVTLEQFYLIWLATYGVCMAVCGRHNRAAQYVMALLTFAGCLGSLALVVGKHDTHFELPKFAIYLCLGMLLYWSLAQKFCPWYFWAAMAAILVAAIVTEESRLYKSFIAAGIFVPLARGWWLPDSVLLRFFAWCGKRAYSIYLVHAIAGIWFLKLTWRIAAERDWLAIPLTLTAGAVSLLSAQVFYHFIEVRFQSKARKVEYRRKGAVPVGPIEVVGNYPAADGVQLALAAQAEG